MRKEFNNEKVHEQNLMAISKQATNQGGGD
jgi:hypothetical protein